MHTYQIDTAKVPNDRSSLQSSESAVVRAAEWLSVQSRQLNNGALITEVKTRFSLSNNDAAEAIRRGMVLRNARAL